MGLSNRKRIGGIEEVGAATKGCVSAFHRVSAGEGSLRWLALVWNNTGCSPGLFQNNRFNSTNNWTTSNVLLSRTKGNFLPMTNDSSGIKKIGN